MVVTWWIAAFLCSDYHKELCYYEEHAKVMVCLLSITESSPCLQE